MSGIGPPPGMGAPPGMSAPKTPAFMSGEKRKRPPPNVTPRVPYAAFKPDFTIPVFQEHCESVDGVEGLEELLSAAHAQMQLWFERQVNRKHYGWSQEKIAKIRAALRSSVEADGLTAEVKAALKLKLADLELECHTFAQGLLDKIKENQLMMEKRKAEREAEKATKKVKREQKQAIKKQAKDKKKLVGEELEAWLALPMCDVLKQVLEDASEPVNSCELAVHYTDKCGKGFAKHYNRKMNHVLNEFPAVFKKQGKKWTLVEAVPMET